MGLNIKNADVHRLASDVTKITGETLTEAVRVALQERLDRIHRDSDREKLIADMTAIAAEFRAEATGPIPDHGDFLYDERGLPK